MSPVIPWLIAAAFVFLLRSEPSRGETAEASALRHETRRAIDAITGSLVALTTRQFRLWAISVPVYFGAVLSLTVAIVRWTEATVSASLSAGFGATPSTVDHPVIGLLSNAVSWIDAHMFLVSMSFSVIVWVIGCTMRWFPTLFVRRGGPYQSA